MRRAGRFPSPGRLGTRPGGPEGAVLDRHAPGATSAGRTRGRAGQVCRHAPGAARGREFAAPEGVPCGPPRAFPAGRSRRRRPWVAPGLGVATHRPPFPGTQPRADTAAPAAAAAACPHGPVAPPDPARDETDPARRREGREAAVRSTTASAVEVQWRGRCAAGGVSA
jgi:hypothetical protein